MREAKRLEATVHENYELLEQPPWIEDNQREEEWVQWDKFGCIGTS